MTEQGREDRELLNKFDADFSRLKRNREKIPLAELQSRYARAYSALVAEVERDAEWWAVTYIDLAVSYFLRHPEDQDGNRQLDREIAAIRESEQKPGGRFERCKAALIQNLDRETYERLVWEIYDRIEREAYLPYWNRHCHWEGEAENRRLYNDIIRMYWYSPDRYPDNWKEKEYFPHGCWVSHDGRRQKSQWPPDIREDTVRL